MAIVSAQAQLVALFNAKNTGLAQALVVADIDFGAVAAYTPADHKDKRNAKLTITAKSGSEHFTGEKELHYTRLAGAALVGNKALTEDQADWDTDEEVLAKFNADVIAAGKTEDAFVASELTFTRTDGGSGEKIITVAIKAGHIKYIEGDAAVYTITQVVVKTDLGTTDGELSGFN